LVEFVGVPFTQNGINGQSELAQKTFPARPGVAPTPVRRVNFRLDEQLVQRLLADYQAGRTGRELAEHHGLARSR
jgi:hypothetical protein